jgi:hypothetical protein
MSKLDARALRIANKIVEHLFRDGGTKRKAVRLVLEHEGKELDGAGWSKEPMRDVIAEHVTKLLQEDN